ncbi:MAG: FAD-dependent oxidoreductase, partial [Holophaga sp.]|nr:FAD-dependent oxidoreductase [Holophaga sp.]
DGGRVRGVRLEDRLTGRTFTVRAGCVVNATGAWTEAVLGMAGTRAAMLRPTKGVHLVIPNARLGNREAFVLRSVDDGRSFFVLRREAITLIGTTDTDYRGDLDEPYCTREDCDYLLRTVNAVFPRARITRHDILSSYAGIRPLVREEGVDASAVSRRHCIRDPGTGLVTIAGGKLTTFRVMAWELLALCSRQGYLRPFRGREKRRNFSRRPLKAGITLRRFTQVVADQGLDNLVPESVLRHLHQQYGQGGVGILAGIKADPGSGRPLLEGHPFCPAELQHILAFENAPSLMDLMLRRTEMQLTVSHLLQRELAGKVAGIMAAFYGWDEARAGEETARYLDHIRKTTAFTGEAHG